MSGTRAFYEAMYREAQEHLRVPAPVPKAERKYWRKQLQIARACSKNYFGAAPPAPVTQVNSQ